MFGLGWREILVLFMVCGGPLVLAAVALAIMVYRVLRRPPGD